MSDWEHIELRMTFERLEQIIRADEREKIAQAIEVEAAKDWGGGHVDGLHAAARIARNGGNE